MPADRSRPSRGILSVGRPQPEDGSRRSGPARPDRRRVLGIGALCGLGLLIAGPAPGLSGGSPAERSATTDDWQLTLNTARGETVVFNAWGGDARVNAYIDWVGRQVARRYGVTLVHVKVPDIGETVARILAEKTAGRHDRGSVDLMWLNGENFLAMKDNGLLFGPFATRLPNVRLLSLADRPTLTRDFTVPTDGLESPWGMTQMVFEYDSARVPDPPATLADLTHWIHTHPGRFTYPAPPDFTGTTFLKQVLHGLVSDPAVLQAPPTDEAFGRVTAPLWSWLAEIRPQLWRQGRIFPPSAPSARQLLGDGEVDIVPSFQTGGASAAIGQGLLPPTVRTFVLTGGMIGNTHFVAIPYNAPAKAGAMVVANFLLDPEAQIHKQDPRVWGDDTVLDPTRLDPADAEALRALPLGIATLPPAERGPILPEPHPAWMTRIESVWLRHHN